MNDRQRMVELTLSMTRGDQKDIKRKEMLRFGLFEGKIMKWGLNFIEKKKLNVSVDRPYLGEYGSD